MAKLNFNPISASYTFAEPAQTLHQSLPGGLPRQRADMIGGMSRLVSATFVCGQAEYEYLIRFIRQNIADDCSLIQIDLLITDSELLEFNAYIVPNTFALDSIDGITFTCSMQFQVIPLDTESTSWPAEWDTDVFQLPSDKSSYTVKYGEEAISVQHSGNTSKQRRTFFNASRLVSLRWNCNKADYITFFKAYRYWTVNGGKPFYMDLFMDRSTILTKHRCTFVPGTVRLSSHQGNLHVVEADIEAESTPWAGTFTSHGDGGTGGGTSGDIPSGENTSLEIGWHEDVQNQLGTVDHNNSGTGLVGYAVEGGGKNDLYASFIGWTSETLVWSLDWVSASGHEAPFIITSADAWVHIQWNNTYGWDPEFPFVTNASIGTLTVNLTVDGAPIQAGHRVIAVTTPPIVDYPSIAWGPEL